MLKKFILMFVLVSTALFAIGCAGEGEVVIGHSPYIGGSKGLATTFESFGIFGGESGLEEIWEGETFPIEVRLENKGEHDIAVGDVVVTIKGINLADFSNIESGVLPNIDEIEKVSDVNKDGGEATIDFTPGEEDAVYNVALTGSSYDVDVFADVVYAYNTYASVPKVCFNRELKDVSVCRVDEAKDVFSSGAPIQVESTVEKSAGTGKIAVEFMIQNHGSGDVTSPGYPFDSRYDKLSFEVSDPGMWECKSSGKLNEARLDTSGKATILCRLKEPLPEGTTPYTKQVDLTLKYDYKEIIHKTIRIKKQ